MLFGIMDRNVIYGAVGCFVGTILSMYIIKYNPHTFLLIVLPMWGLVMGISIARTVNVYSEKPKKK